jgi:hypothetical protein
VLAALGASRQQAEAMADHSLGMADPWDALVCFLERGLDLLCVNLGLRDIMIGPPLQETGELAAEFGSAGGDLLRRAARAGRVRDGLTAADLLLLQCALSEMARHCRGVHESLPRRFLQVFLDGIQVCAKPARGQPRLQPGRGL